MQRELRSGLQRITTKENRSENFQANDAELRSMKPPPPNQDETFTLTLRAPARDRLGRTLVMRLKALLKAAWRGYGLRAEYLAPSTDEKPPTQSKL
jgi:hypothetical protein